MKSVEAFCTRIVLMHFSSLLVSHITNARLAPTLENAALYKPTSQGPRTFRLDGHSYSSSFAVDGMNSSLYRDCASTDTAPLKWWTVDLLRTRKIHSVRILNRVTYAFRLQNITVDVFTENPAETPGFPAATGQVCGSRKDTIGSAAWAEIVCSEIVEGRFVRILKGHFQHLSLCEVEVLAEELELDLETAQLTYEQARGAMAVTTPKQSLGTFSSARTCALGLLSETEHNGFEFNTQTLECRTFQTSPLKGDGAGLSRLEYVYDYRKIAV